MRDTKRSAVRRSAGRLARVTRGLVRPSTRSYYVGAVRRRISAILAPATEGVCIVCGSSARVVTVTQPMAATATRPPRTFHVLVCQVCGHVGNPENTHDYRNYLSIDKLTPSARIGTPERPGREFHMAAMAIDILGRDDIEVLIFGAGRSYDNHHIAALPQVRNVAIADIMRLREDAEFIDANLPAPRRFAVVIASEVVEHFLDPRKDFASFFDYLEPDGLLVCSTNLYDGGDLSNQAYLFYRGHVSYYSSGSLARIAEENGQFLDLRVPLVATGYAGQRKRYLLFTKSAAVMEATARYFSTRPYAPSDSPMADVEFVATQATTGEGAAPVGSGR